MLINDVTTDLDMPPEIIDLKNSKVVPYPESFKSIQKKMHSDIVPLPWPDSREAAFEAVLKTAAGMKRWELVTKDLKKWRAQYVVTTQILRFKDDVVIEVREPSGTSKQAEVHMRSRSRVGLSDLGANAQRIRDFFAKLQE